MKKIISFFIAFLLGLIIPLTFYSQIYAASQKSFSLISPIPLSNKLTDNSTINNESSLSNNTLLNKPVSILLLGVDGRKSDKNPRCDAIHTIKYDPNVGKITIYSIPRGTPVKIGRAHV